MTDDSKKPPCTAERYAGAISNGSTKVGRDASLSTAGDIVAAAGMSRYRTGMALMRLASEWHSGAVPRAGRLPEVKELAWEQAASRVEREIASRPNLQVSEKRAMRAAVTVTKADMDLAHTELARLQARATDWTLQENQLRFQRMKSLPALRTALLHWAADREWEDAEHIVAKVLQRFLSPVCPVCCGTGRKNEPGTLGRTATVRCKAEGCQGGEAKVPHGGRGKRLLDYLEVCTKMAAGDLREGLQRMHRGAGSTEARERMAAADAAEKQVRVDREAAADAAQDTGAVAETFRQSMGNRRQR
jgi:hypothetical protein